MYLNRLYFLINKIVVLLLLLATPFLSFAQILSVEMVDVSSSEVPADSGSSISLDFSPDGRYIVFVSGATNLVSGDTNGVSDIFVRDMTLGTTEIVSVDSDENLGNNYSSIGSISSDGRYVVFVSDASNLVSGDINAVSDVFIRDRTLGTTEIISLSPSDDPSDGNSYISLITHDGAYVAFQADASNLVAGDTNIKQDVFVWEMATGNIEMVSVSSDEDISNGDSGGFGLISISDDGRYVVFDSDASNLVSGDTNGVPDVFVRDTVLGTTERISTSTLGVEGDGDSMASSISFDGDYVSFYSNATNLVSGDTNGTTDVFIRNLNLDTTTRVSVNSEGVQGNGESTYSFVSDNGRFVTYDSESTNLVSDDTNLSPDTFIYDSYTGETKRISLTENEEEASGATSRSTSLGVLSGDARYIVLSSGHSDIVTGDLNNDLSVFLYELDDDDGISAVEEQASPNSGDADSDSFADSVEHDTTSFNNTQSGGYTTVISSGDCANNTNVSLISESDLSSADTQYNYNQGIIDFDIYCTFLEPGGTADVTIYFFGNVDISGLSLRKVSDNGTSTPISNATITETTISGENAVQVTYSIIDGGELDEDGVANGIIVDPVGLATSSEVSSGGGASSGSGTTFGSKLRKIAQSENVTFKAESLICYTFTTPMSQGSKYGEIPKLQEILNTLGFDSGVVDGLFGPKTHLAVKTFQKFKNITSDGIVGPITRGELNKCN